MTSEGGGKLRQKKSRSLAKPYDRPKSLVGRLKDTVVNIFVPSWVSSLVSRSADSTQSECPPSSDDDEENEVKTTTSSSSYPFPHIASPIVKSGLGAGAGVGGGGAAAIKLNSRVNLQRAALPLHSPSFYTNRSNHDREDASSSAASGGLAGDDDDDEVMMMAGPSTSTPIAGVTSSAYSAALANARQFSAARRRRGVGGGGLQENETNRVAAHPIFNSSVVAAAASNNNNNNNNGSNSKPYAKLSDIAKLNEETRRSTTEKKSSFINSDHIALDSQSECSEESMSTSGCSSMVPHPDKREYQREILPLNKAHLATIDEDLVQANEQSKAWGFGSELSERKSFLFPDSNRNDRISKPQPAGFSSRPQFNPSLLGTSLWSEIASMGNSIRSRTDSPYLGKVTYGFGSSTKRPRSCTPYDMESTKRYSVQAKVYRTDDVMSSTAKKILSSLEKMSTPLADAKKIPTGNVLSPVLETPLNFNPSKRRRPNLSNRKLSHLETSYAQKLITGPPPTQRIMTPATVYVRSITKPTQNEMSTNEISNPSVPLSSAGSSSQMIPKMNSKAGSGGGKIRARPEPMHYSASAADKHEVVEMPDLPAISLPIQTLPVFDLHPQTAFKVSPLKSFPPASTVSPLSGSKPSIFSNNLLTTATATPPRLFKTSETQPLTPSVPTFTFSTPLVKQDIRSINGSPQISPPALPNYAFHSPIVESVTSPTRTTPKSDGLKDFVSSSSSLKRKQVDEVVKESPSAGFKVASELKTGSVMDILGKSSSSSVTSEKAKEKTSVDSTSLAKQFRPASSSWNCAECWVNNKSEDAKCAACGSCKPEAKTSKPSTSASAVSSLPPPPAYVNTWGDKFRPAADTWECPGCMLRVESKLDKCRACETPNPKAGNNSSSSSSSINTKSGGEWVCDICFVKNDQSKTSCSACQSIKLKKSTGPMPQTSGFKFGFSTSSTTSTSTNITSGSISAFTSVSSASTAGGSLFKFSVGVSSAQPTPSTGFKFGFADTTTSTEKAAESSVVSSTPAAAASLLALSTDAVSSSIRTATTTSSGFKFGQQASSTNVVTSTTAPMVSSSSEPSGNNAPVEDKDTQPSASKTTGAATTAFTMPAAPSFSFKVGGTSNVSSAVSTSLFSAAATSTAPSTDAKAESTFAFTAPPPLLASTNTAAVTTTSALLTAASTANPTTTAAKGGFAFSFSSPSSTIAPTTSAPPPSFNFNPPSTVTSTPPQPIKSTNLFGSSTPSSGFSFGNSASNNLLSTKSISSLKPEGSGPLEAAKVQTFGALSGGVSSSAKSDVGGGGSGGFTFKSTPTPVFGALSTVGEKSPASNTFTFGSSSSSTTAATTSSGMSLFGATDSLKTTTPLLASTSKFSVGSSTATSSGLNFNPTNTFTSPAQGSFTFGSTATKLGAGSVGGSATPSFGTVAASAPSNNPSPAFGGFGNLSSQQQPTAAVAPSSSGFAFGATPAAPTLAAQNSGFAFGQAQQPAQNPGIFNFTGNQATPPQPTVPNLQPSNSFGFGNVSQQQQQQQQQQQASGQGFNFNPQQTPNFNFGPAAAPGTTQPAYEFSANPFDAHQSAANRNAPRPIRKAKRRTNK